MPPNALPQPYPTAHARPPQLAPQPSPHPHPHSHSHPHPHPHPDPDLYAHAHSHPHSRPYPHPGLQLQPCACAHAPAPARSAAAAPGRAGLRLGAVALAATLWALAPSSQAATGKLLLTGGVGSVEGASGGGLTPWALVGTGATQGEWGAAATISHAQTQDYRLTLAAVTLGWGDRAEVSVARQSFDTGDTGTALGLPGLRLRQDVLGAKLRLAGEAVLDSDRWMPQLALGLQAKRVHAGGLAPTLAALGASRSGVDIYASATKLLLGPGLLLNATLRATQANQTGLLGFGASGRHHYKLLPEVSVAWLLHRTLAVGLEYRVKPDQLNPSVMGAGLKEDDWADAFVAWAPAKQVSVTAAWVDLGAIVPAVKPRRQTGGWLSVQLTH